MRLLVGLGNPEPIHAKTRHNLGFLCLDAVAAAIPNLTWKEFKDGMLATGKLKNTQIALFKPMQYMNNSGIQVRQVVDYYNLASEDIAAVYDDVYVEPGSARIRHSGGDGGHNGVKSLLDHLEDDRFWRIRLGAGLYEQKPEDRHHLPPLEDYVLQKLPSHDQKKVDHLIDRLVPDLLTWLEHGTGLDQKTVHS